MADDYADLIPTRRGSEGYEDLVPRGTPPQLRDTPSVSRLQVPPKVEAATDVINRAIVAGTLGTPVDLLNLGLRYGVSPLLASEQPVGGSEWIGSQMEKMGLVSPTRRPLAETITGFAPLGMTAIGGLGRAGTRLAKTAFGGPSKKYAEQVKKGAVALYEEPIAEAERARATASRAIEQMERQPAVAAERATRAPLTREQEIAELQRQVREPTRAEFASRRGTAEERARIASEEAQVASERSTAAQNVVNQLEQRLLSNPMMTADQFGAELKAATKKMQSDLVKARTEGSTLGRVINEAGDSPSVNTSNVIDKIKELKTKTKNPQVTSMLDEIEYLAKTKKDDSVIDAISLSQADSLRKYLSKDILAKFFPQTGADKEVLRSLKQIRGSLIDSTPQAYREALGEFSRLSRPLDIVERQGALRRVVDVDAMSTAEKLTEAQVTGEIINKARAGHPVFTRLLQTDPSLKESGRLYFTQDLFGKDTVPTVTSLKNWLLKNERPLRQLGLYDEFKDISTARKTAQDVVNETKLAETTAGRVAGEAIQEAKKAAKLSQESARRLEEAISGTAFPKVRPGEELADALRRSRGERAAPIETFKGTREEKQMAIMSLTKMQDDINAARTPKDVQQIVNRAADDLYNRGILNREDRNAMLKGVEKIQSMEDAKNKARSVATKIAIAIGVPALGLKIVF